MGMLEEPVRFPHAFVLLSNSCWRHTERQSTEAGPFSFSWQWLFSFLLCWGKGKKERRIRLKWKCDGFWQWSYPKGGGLHGQEENLKRLIKFSSIEKLRRKNEILLRVASLNVCLCGTFFWCWWRRDVICDVLIYEELRFSTIHRLKFKSLP